MCILYCNKHAACNRESKSTNHHVMHLQLGFSSLLFFTGWLFNVQLACISLSFILIYRNQSALSQMACSKELLALSEDMRWEPACRMCCFPSDKWQITAHQHESAYRALKVFTVRLASRKRKERLKWIINVLLIRSYEFFTRRGALQMHVKSSQIKTCWEHNCVCGALDVHSCPSCAS